MFLFGFCYSDKKKKKKIIVSCNLKSLNLNLQVIFVKIKRKSWNKLSWHDQPSLHQLKLNLCVFGGFGGKSWSDAGSFFLPPCWVLWVYSPSFWCLFSPQNPQGTTAPGPHGVIGVDLLFCGIRDFWVLTAGRFYSLPIHIYRALHASLLFFPSMFFFPPSFLCVFQSLNSPQIWESELQSVMRGWKCVEMTAREGWKCHPHHRFGKPPCQGE